MSVSNDLLVKAVKTRTKQTEFGYGILTADRYVKSLQECVGNDMCYRYAASRSTSFHDILTKAASTLVYSNRDMVVEDIYTKAKEHKDLKGIELPKNTLMVFKHILTTPRKDRDGDILRTKGAVLDPKLPLLWQHVHTLPIGKMLRVSEHTKDRISLVSAVIDINELAHDSAVMIDNGMGRFSHGFRALEFEEMKSADGRSHSGFDIKSFEVMEESLVSVPSNIDAEEEEVILSLVEGRKLTSNMMKEVGRTIREKRPISVPVQITFDVKVKEPNYENMPGNGSSTKEGSTGCSCASKEAHENAGQRAEDTDNKEVTETCPKCGGKLDKQYQCSDCGTDCKKSYQSPIRVKSSDESEETSDSEVENESPTSKKGKKCSKCGAKLVDGVCPDCEEEDEDEEESDEKRVEQAMSTVIALSTPEQRKHFLDVLQTLSSVEQRESKAKQLQDLIGNQ